MWDLVQFDDQVYSIDKLQNLENEEGETGENLDLTERARCMADYDKEYNPATVICMNGLYMHIKCRFKKPIFNLMNDENFQQNVFLKQLVTSFFIL